MSDWVDRETVTAGFQSLSINPVGLGYNFQQPCPTQQQLLNSSPAIQDSRSMNWSIDPDVTSANTVRNMAHQLHTVSKQDDNRNQHRRTPGFERANSWNGLSPVVSPVQPSPPFQGMFHLKQPFLLPPNSTRFAGNQYYNGPIQRPVRAMRSAQLTSPLSVVKDSYDMSTSSEDDDQLSHPNKYPVAIEEHRRSDCCYKRQTARSGPYMKVIKDSGETFILKGNGNEAIESFTDAGAEPPQIKKFYRKDLVRRCLCGMYTDMEHMLNNNGRANDCDGYEIHYSAKCKWKFYEDFKTKKRVLIRLCKCYKPA